MTVKLGTNPIAWTNDDHPELGGDTSLDQCLSETRQAGFSGTEMGGKFPKDAANLAPILASHGLEFISAWWDGTAFENEVEKEFDTILPHLEFLKQIGAKYVVYADSSNGRHGGLWEPISNRPKLAEDEWEAYGAKLTKLADKMAEFGVSMAFHHHIGTIVETEAEIDRLMEVTGPSVGLLFDTGHCVFGGGDPVKVCENHKERIVHVHCKDVRTDKLIKARKNDVSNMEAIIDGIYTVPGDGAIDFPSILGSLKSVDYSGWLVVEAEQDPKKAPPLFYATLGHKNLSQMAEAAGFQISR